MSPTQAIPHWKTFVFMHDEKTDQVPRRPWKERVYQWGPIATTTLEPMKQERERVDRFWLEREQKKNNMMPDFEYRDGQDPRRRTQEQGRQLPYQGQPPRLPAYTNPPVPSRAPRAQHFAAPLPQQQNFMPSQRMGPPPPQQVACAAPRHQNGFMFNANSMNVFMQAPTVPMAQFPSMAQPNVDAPACDPYHGQSYLMQHYEQQHPDFARTSNLGASDGYFSGNEHAGCPITAPSANAPASMNYPLNMHFGATRPAADGFLNDWDFQYLSPAKYSSSIFRRGLWVSMSFEVGH